MNLLEIRQQFRTLSGRNDLVTAAGVDNGADFFINAGMKWLDIQGFQTKKSVGRVFRIAAIGDFAVTFPYCRAIKEVWAATTADGRWQLYKKDVQDFRETYYNVPSAITNGIVTHYTPAYLRAVPKTESTLLSDFDAIVGYADVMAGENYEFNGIIFMPPPSVETMIEVWGKFYTEPLEDDGDNNYWSVVHPSILIAAALREVEVFNRNTQGVNDMTNTILDKLSGIDQDAVDEDLSEADQMEG